MQPPVLLPRAVHAEIIAHAQEGAPEEVCGLLRGRGNRAAELFRAENLAEDKLNNYIVDPKALLHQFHFEDLGDEMMGIYHSHPASVAYPSASDAWHAYYPDSAYFICSLAQADAPAIRAFRLIPRFLAPSPKQMADLLAQIPFHESRPALFAHFQAADKAVAPALAVLAEATAAPYYVLFTGDPEWDGSEVRLVTVREAPVLLV